MNDGRSEVERMISLPTARSRKSDGAPARVRTHRTDQHTALTNRTVLNCTRYSRTGGGRARATIVFSRGWLAGTGLGGLESWMAQAERVRPKIGGHAPVRGRRVVLDLLLLYLFIFRLCGPGVMLMLMLMLMPTHQRSDMLNKYEESEAICCRKGGRENTRC